MPELLDRRSGTLMIAHCPYLGGEGTSCCLSDVVSLSSQGFGILFMAMLVAQKIQEKGIFCRLEYAYLSSELKKKQVLTMMGSQRVPCCFRTLPGSGRTCTEF